MKRLVLLFCLCFCAIPCLAQGCSQCAEIVGQTPARTQAAYRKAILVMVFGATGLGLASVFAIRRFR